MSQVYIDLIYNAALLITLGTIYDALSLRRYNRENKIGFQLLTGLLLAFIGVAVMERPWQIIPGVRIDARTILLSVSGLFFGLLPTVVASAVAIVYRTMLGGLGMETGYGLILSAAGLGLAWRYLRKRYLSNLNWLELYAFGIVVHIVMLVWMYNLPSPLDVEVLRHISLPVMLFYPAVTVLLGRLLAHQTFQHESRETLQLSEAHYRRIVETAAEGIWAVNTQGFTTFVNPSLTAITGYSKEEMLGKPMSDFISGTSAPLGAIHAQKPEFTGQPTVESTYQRKDGQLVWTRVSVTPLINEKGEMDGALAMVTDITAQKHAEEELQQRNTLIETILANLPVGLAVINTQTGRFDYINDHYGNLFGITDTVDTDPQQHFTSLFPDENYRKQIDEIVHTTISVPNPKDTPWEGVKVTLADGSVRIINGTTIPLPEQHLIITTAQDVTERHHMEQTVRNSEQLFRSLFEQSSAGAAQVDATGKFMQVNNRLCEIIGYSREELLRVNFSDITYPPDAHLDQEQVERVRAGLTETFIIEKRYVHKQGHTVWVRVHGNVVRDAESKQLYTVVNVVDITESRQAEEERRQQQELLQSVVDNIPVMIAMHDKDGKYLLSNRAFTDTMGWDMAEYDNAEVLLRKIYPDAEMRQRVLDGIVQGDLIWRNYQSRNRAGQTLQTSWASTMLSNGNSISFGMDITERHQMETAMRESERLFKSIFEQSAVGTAQVGADARILRVNARLSDIVGFSREELLTMTYIDLTHPDDREQTLAQIAQIRSAQQKEFVLETRCIHKEGHPIWVELHGNVVRDADGLQIYSVVMIVDITERHLAEQERRRQQELLQSIVDNIPVMIVMTDAEGRYTFTNHAHEQITGWNLEEFDNETELLSLIYPDDTYREEIINEIKSGDNIWRDNISQTKHGHSIHSSWANVTLSDGSRIGFGMDVTERHNMESALRNSEQLFKSIFEQSAAGVAQMSPRGEYMLVNTRLCEILGYSKEELLRMTYQEITHPDDPDIDRRAVEAITMENRETFIFEKRYIHKTGHVIWARLHGNTIFDEDGEWLYNIVVVVDITEEHLAEVERRRQQELLQAIVDTIPVMIVMGDPDGNFLMVNRAYENIMGWDINSHQNTAEMLAAAYPNGRQLQEVSGAINQGAAVWNDFETMTGYGSTIHSSWANAILSDGSHIGFGMDITARKRAEIELQQHKNLLQTIMDNLPVCVNLSDPEGNYVFLNRAYQNILGWTIEETPTVEAMLALANPDPDELESNRIRIETSDGIWLDCIARTRDGHEIPMMWVDIRLPDGSHLGIGQDITERKQAESELQEQKDLLQTIIDNLPILVNMTDPDGNYIFTNNGMLKTLGWTMKDFPDVETMLGIVYADEKTRTSARNNIASCDGQWKFYAARTRDGSIIPMSWINIRLPNGNHLGIGQDITERKLVEQRMRDLNVELDRRVTKRTAELESRNRELQTFTYSVSHDLKAPLRGIDGYSRLLEMQYKDKLDSEGLHFIGQVRHATELMGRLIEDLLSYSRLEQQPMLIREVKLRSWLELVLDELAPQIELAGVDVVVDVPDISISADPDGLSIAMRNLIDNALKFSIEVPNPRIEIGAESCETCHRLWVKDNGIGFDMQFHDRIFGIFQRLHRAEDYPGTGVGLAIVQRSMQRMGGRAWAESGAGKGATFYIEIPVTEHGNNS